MKHSPQFDTKPRPEPARGWSSPGPERQKSAGRICFVIGSLDLGGTENHLVRVLPALKAHGWDPFVFCISREGTQAKHLQAAGVPVYAGNDIEASSRSPLTRGLRVFRGGLRLSRLLRREKPSIVHFFLPQAYLLGAPISILNGIPIRIMSRRGLAYYHRKWPGVRLMERELHRHMTAITGNCRAILRELAEEGVPESKLRLMYNGIEVTGPTVDRATARAELGLDPHCLIGVTVANLIPYKGHEDLIEALAIAAPKLPVPWKFLCVGRDDGPLAALSALAEKRGIGGNVEFLGPRLDVDRILAAADFGVLPSRDNEGFSNAILESMNAGLPMVVTDVGGNAEAVSSGETGFVVPAFNPEALAAAILRLATDPALRSQLGNAGLDRVKTAFTLDQSVADYCDLYVDLLDLRAS